MFQGFAYSLIAGFFAALASVFGKLSLSDSGAKTLCIQCIPTQHGFCESMAPVLRGFSFLLILITNALMWRFFAKSLNVSSTTVEATSVNAASNFLFTALFSVLIFGERISLQWMFGLSLVITGLALVHYSINQTKSMKQTKES